MSRIAINDLNSNYSYLTELNEYEDIYVLGGGKFWDWVKDHVSIGWSSKKGFI